MTQATSLSHIQVREFDIFLLEFSYFVLFDLLRLILLWFIAGKSQTSSDWLLNAYASEQVHRPALNSPRSDFKGGTIW